MGRWADAEQMLRALAESDLEAGCEVVAPCLAAFAGDHPRFLAFVRAFEAGGYVAPMTELLALAVPLDADRLAFSVSGRAWSLDDPIPPVTAEADLRQRVVCIELVDGGDGRPRRTSVLLPYELPPGAPAGSSPGISIGPGISVRWGQRQVLPGGEGWIGEALTFAVSARARQAMRAPDELIARQAMRVAALGHGLLLAEDVADRLGLPARPA